MNYIKYKDFMV